MAKTNRDVTVYGRLSYEHLFAPQAPSENAAPKYSATVLIPKSDTATIQRVLAAIQAAVKDGVERKVFKQPIDPAHTKYPPLRDGDSLTDSGEARGPEFAGHWFISAKATMKNRPFVVDGQLQPIIDESEVYSGCYINAAIQFYAYENSGNKGVAASLTGVQKVQDGERLGGAVVEASDVFSVLPAQPTAQPALGGFGQPAPAAQPGAQPGSTYGF